jgi:O-antigen/teichoic acid export membrane protein
VWSRASSTFGRSSLTIWLIVVEASLVVPIWLLRPIVSLRGSDADVAALSVALQFATPVFSLVAVLGQALWPFYARNRMTLHRRDVLRHSAAMAGLSMGLAACYAFGLWGLIRADLVGHGAGTALLTAMAFYIVARGAWEPARIIFSTDQTARHLAGICVASCCVAVLLMWSLTDVGHASYAVLAVAVAFAANTVIASLLLTSRLHRGGVVAG